MVQLFFFLISAWREQVETWKTAAAQSGPAPWGPAPASCKPFPQPTQTQPLQKSWSWQAHGELHYISILRPKAVWQKQKSGRKKI